MDVLQPHRPLAQRPEGGGQVPDPHLAQLAPVAEALPPGGMCQYKVKLSATHEVDAELIAWIRRAYDSAG